MTDEGSRRIPLSQGLEAVVDAEDYDALNQWKWSARKWQAKGLGREQGYAYACRADGNGKWLYMHRLIADAPSGAIVDHINHDGLDNRKCNLRICTTSENCRNIGQRTWGKSGYWGVLKNPRYRGWRSQIYVNGEALPLGTYNTPEDAARAYDAAARKYHGEFAKQNFPEDAPNG